MSLEHPNVVPIYDAGEVDGRVYLAMRLVDGTDLGSLLRTEGALQPARAITICTQTPIARAGSSAPSVRKSDPRSLPSTSRIARYTRPSTSPAS